MQTVSIFDGSFIRLKDNNVVIPEHELSIENYLYGRCHLFALALKEVFSKRAQIMTIIEIIDGREFLCHAYTLIDNAFMVDARGVISEYDLQQYTDNALEHFTINEAVKVVKQNANDNMWGEPKTDEMTLLVQFIKNNIHLYEANFSQMNDPDSSIEQFLFEHQHHYVLHDDVDFFDNAPMSLIA